MPGILEGKVALVTGAGRGLGRTHALALAAAGAAVMINDLGGTIDGQGADAGPAQAVALEIADSGGRAASDTHDVSSWDGAGALVAATVAAFGRLDIVVNNAGISAFNSIDRETPENWHRVIGVNLTGSAAVSHWAAAHWREAGPQAGRAIVNTGSPAGTNPLPGGPAYCVSKAGVAALTLASAYDLAELGVRVNAIAPMARTRMTLAVPMLDAIMATVTDRFDRVAPEHISQVMLYLASPDCDFTGRVFGCEGDDVFLFSGFSADTHINNGGAAWTPNALGQALADVDRQDRGYAIAPSMRFPGPAPTDDVFEALATVSSQRSAA